MRTNWRRRLGWTLGLGGVLVVWFVPMSPLLSLGVETVGAVAMLRACIHREVL